MYVCLYFGGSLCQSLLCSQNMLMLTLIDVRVKVANKIKSWYFKLFSQSDLYFKCLEALSWSTPQKPILNSVKHFCGYLKKCIIWLPRALSRPCLKIFPWKKFLIFFPKKIKKIKKKIVIFSEKKAFLIFRETELFKKSSLISGENFPSSKNKKNPLWKNFSWNKYSN